MSETLNNTVVRLMARLLAQYQQLKVQIERVQIDSSEALQEVAVQLRSIKETERELRPLREQLRDSTPQEDQELQALNETTIAVIQEVIPMLNELETQARESFGKLFPSVQASVRGMLMKNAYSG